MTPQQKEAYLRGALTAIGVFLMTLLGQLYIDAETDKALMLSGIAALTSLGVRGGVEGVYDAARAKKGEVRASDVGASRPTV